MEKLELDENQTEIENYLRTNGFKGDIINILSASDF